MTEQKLSNRDTLVQKIVIFFGELTATAILLFLGCMGCLQTESIVNSHFQISICFGIVVLICIQCFGCVSGAHLNPAVTLASCVYNMTSISMGFVYLLAQMLGACIGYGLLVALIPGKMMKGLCVTSVTSVVTLWQAALIEFFITCVLITICCAIWDPRNASAHDSIPFRFGLSIGCLSLAAGQLTGASMNPARSFAPAVWNNSWKDHWIYWVSPLIASLVTSLVYKFFFRAKDNPPPKKNEA